MQKRNNIIIGDLIIDQNYLTKLVGKSAEFNAKKFFLIKKNFNFGGAGMVYDAFRKLNKDIDFFTISSKKFKNLFYKLNLKNIFYSENFTIEKKRYWSEDKLLFQLNNIRLNTAEIKKYQIQLLKKITKLNKFSNIILCDYRYGIFSNNFTKKIIRILNEKKCVIYVDQQSTTKDPDISKFKNINYLILNNLEYQKIFKIYKIDGKNLLTKLSKLQKISNIKTFVVKTGSKGCLVFKNNKIIKSKPPLKVYSNLNTIGAGDYFLACFVNKSKENLPKRIKLSNDYAFSKIVGKSKVKKY